MRLSRSRVAGLGGRAIRFPDIIVGDRAKCAKLYVFSSCSNMRYMSRSRVNIQVCEHIALSAHQSSRGESL